MISTYFGTHLAKPVNPTFGSTVALNASDNYQALRRELHEHIFGTADPGSKSATHFEYSGAAMHQFAKAIGLSGDDVVYMLGENDLTTVPGRYRRNGHDLVGSPIVALAALVATRGNGFGAGVPSVVSLDYVQATAPQFFQVLTMQDKAQAKKILLEIADDLFMPRHSQMIKLIALNLEHLQYNSQDKTLSYTGSGDITYPSRDR